MADSTVTHVLRLLSFSVWVRAHGVLAPFLSSRSFPRGRKSRGASSFGTGHVAHLLTPCVLLLCSAKGNSSKPHSDSGSPEYIAFLLVPAFFLLGLLGVLICHILKRRGYRCTTEAEGEDEGEVLEDEKDKDPECAAELNDTFSDTENDTVGHIVHYIMKNQANSDALKAMLHENSIDFDGRMFWVTMTLYSLHSLMASNPTMGAAMTIVQVTA